MTVPGEMLPSWYCILIIEGPFLATFFGTAINPFSRLIINPTESTVASVSPTKGTLTLLFMLTIPF